MLTNNVDIYAENKGWTDNISDEQVETLKVLLNSWLSGEEWNGNQYIWSIFKEYVSHKHEIVFGVDALVKFYKNEGFYGLLLSSWLKKVHSADEVYSENEWTNQNLLKREILSIFKNVTQLEIWCSEYPLSLKSLLSLITDTQINRVVVFGYPKFYTRKENVDAVSNLKSTSFDYRDILSEYKQANFTMEVKKEQTVLIITSIR